MIEIQEILQLKFHHHSYNSNISYKHTRLSKDFSKHAHIPRSTFFPRRHLPCCAALLLMLLLAPVTLALWDLVAGLRLLVGVLLLSGVALPLSFFTLPRSLGSLGSLPSGGMPLSICSMLEEPGAHIEAERVLRRRLCWWCCCSAIILRSRILDRF